MMVSKFFWLLVFVLTLLGIYVAPALAQQSLLWSGAPTPGHTTVLVNSGGYQPIVKDAGGAAGGAVGVNPTELGLTEQSTFGNTAPYANAGTGPLSTNFCDYDGPTTGAYHYLCMSPNAQGGGLIAYGAAGGATAEPFGFEINGTFVSFPSASSLGFPNVSTTSALENLSLSGLAAGSVVMKSGYYVSGDMPPVAYVLSTSACSLNAGAGDLGGQIPSVTSGNCWIIAPQTTYDARSWGVIYGGADPNNNNAALLSAAFSYVGNITSTAGIPQPTIAVNGPVMVDATANITGAYLSVSLLNLVAGPGLAPSGGVCPAVLAMTTTGTHNFGNIQIDVNRQSGVDGFHSQVNGTNHYNFMQIKHWTGICGSVQVSGASATSGTQDITVTNSAGVTTGMVSRGNTGIPDRSVVVDVPDSTDIIISKATTGTVSGVLTFDSDANGVVCGFNNSNCGGTWQDVNLFQWLNNDPEVGVNADRYGYSFDCTGDCNDVAIVHGLIQEGVASIFEDQNASGLHLTADLELNNNNYSTNELNSPCVLLAAGAGPFTMNGGQINGCVVQSFVTRASGANSSQSAIQITGVKVTTSSNVTQTPAATIQLYNNQTLKSFSNVTFNGFSNVIPTSLTPALEYGPGSVGQGGLPNTINFSGTILNGLVGDESYSNSTTLTAADCGYMIQINNGTGAATITLPDSLSGIGTFASCPIWIFANGPNVTLAPASAGLINGANTSVSLAKYTLYAIQTAGIPSTAFEWAVNPPPPLNAAPTSLTNTAGQTIGQLAIQSGLILRSGPTANFTDTTTSAGNIVGVIPNEAVNTGYDFRVVNNSSFVETIAGGTNVSTSGTMTIAAGTWRDFRALITALGATPTITIYDKAGGTIN